MGSRHGPSTLRYEDAAGLATLEVWVCVVCQAIYRDEHRARVCHAIDVPCDSVLVGDDGVARPCPDRATRFQRCRGCTDLRATRRWEERLEHAKDWDGESPLYSEAYGRWVAPWDADDVEELRAQVGQWELCTSTPLLGICCESTEDRTRMNKDGRREHFALPSLEDLRLVLATPNDPPIFDLGEHCYDSLPDDDDKELPGTGEEQATAEEAVNDYLEAHSPWSWVQTCTPVTVESLKVRT